MRQIIDLRDSNKSQYFAITEFLLFFHSITNFVFLFKSAQGHYLPFFTQEHGYNTYAWVEYYLQQNTC